MYRHENGSEPLDAAARARLSPRRRGDSCLWLVLLVGCSEAPGPDAALTDPVILPDDPLSPSADATGGTEAGTGGVGSGGDSQVSSGGSGGSMDPPTPSTEIQIDEATLGFCSVDGFIEATNTGFSGDGYANSDNAVGAQIEWAVQVSQAGQYTLDFVYANGGDTDRAGALSLNGSELEAVVSLPSTGDWTTWSSLSVEVALEEGESRIVLSATTEAGLANLDSLIVRGAGVAPHDCASSVGTGGAPGTGGMDPGTGGAGELPNTTIYVAGDSTVSTYNDTASPNDQAGWGQMLAEIFDDRVTVENRAAGGRTARWFHLEGGTKYVLDRIKPGEYWLIQFGTNDSHKTATFTVGGVTYQRYADPNTDFKDHLLNYFVIPARAKSAVPVLVTPPPRNSGYCGQGNSLGGYAQAMRDLAAAENIVLLDLNQRSFDHLAAICPAPTPEDFFFRRADGSVDGTHFQENGARHMAGFLGHEMTDQALGPFRYLLP